MLHFLPKPFRAGLLCGMTLGLGFLASTERLLAGNYIVSPVQVYLSPKPDQSPSSSLLVLRNTSQTPLRFQLNAFVWNQNVDGSIQLQPTEDVILFPTLVTLLPGESRNVRLGVVTTAKEQEKTYRVVVEELPPLESTKPQSSRLNLTMLVKMSIPIFLQPTNPTPNGEIQGIVARSGKLQFQLLNTGNAHYVAQEIKVQATNTSGKVLFEQSTSGWYMLAGGIRQYNLMLPNTNCSQVSSLSVTVKTDKDNFQNSISTPNGICK